MPIFSSITSWIVGGLVAALLASGMWLAWDYKSQAGTIQGLKDQLAIAQNAAKVAKTNLELRDEAINSLTENMSRRIAEGQRNCDLLQDAASDKSPDADKPVGGVIGNILGHIDAPPIPLTPKKGTKK